MSHAPRMRPGERPGTLRASRPNFLIGIAVSVASVAVATAAISALRHLAPVVSLSVVYLPAVLLVSAYWGLALGLGTSLLSAAAFNFFHLPPTGRFTIADSRNWVALAAFTVVAVAVSTVAELARSRASEVDRRRAEADLAAAVARDLLGGSETESALAAAARRVADALGISAASIELGAVEGDRQRRALELSGADGKQIATLFVPRRLPAETEHRLRGARRAGARGARGDRAAPRRAPGRGSRDRGAAAQRRHQDRAAPCGLARPAHPGDRDRRRRPRARERFADRRRARRAQHRRHRGRRAARRARRQAARPVASAGRPGGAAPGLGLARGRRARGPRGAVGVRSRKRAADHRPRRAAGQGRCRPARAGVREPARERRAVLGRAARVGARPPQRTAGGRHGWSTRGPGSASPSAARIFEPFYRGAGHGRRGGGPAPAWDWRSPRGSSRPTTARSRSSRSPARARASWSRCRSSCRYSPSPRPSRLPT